jgi:hypothetical protein
MPIELTAQQRLLVQQEAGRPVEVVDPETNRHYVLVPREQFEQLGPFSREETAADAVREVPPGIRRSQAALRRDLPGLLEQPKLRGQWVLYHGDERIAIAKQGITLLRECNRRGWRDDEYYVGWIDPCELSEEEELEPPSPDLLEETEADKPLSN